LGKKIGPFIWERDAILRKGLQGEGEGNGSKDLKKKGLRGF